MNLGSRAKLFYLSLAGSETMSILFKEKRQVEADKKFLTPV